MSIVNTALCVIMNEDRLHVNCSCYKTHTHTHTQLRTFLEDMVSAWVVVMVSEGYVYVQINQDE